MKSKKQSFKSRYAHLYKGQLVSYQGREVKIEAKYPQFHQFFYYNGPDDGRYGDLSQCKPLEGQIPIKF